MSHSEQRRTSLADRFVSTFSELNDMQEFGDLDPVAGALSVGEPNEYGAKRWQPAKIVTDPSALEPLYAGLPARFPPLYEKLILSYRWAEVDLTLYRLLANPLGIGLSGLFNEISADKFLFRSLTQAGFIPFGKGPDLNYDPVCFDLRSRKKNKECKIVRLDHEEILCNERIKVVAELATSFEALVSDTILRAEKKKEQSHT